jgi:hypothetical protein
MKGGGCTQVSRTGELKKPAHQKVPYAQPPSNAGKKYLPGGSSYNFNSNGRLNPATDDQ